MKYLFKLVFMTLAFLVVVPGVFLYCLWHLDFSTLRSMWFDQKMIIREPMYKLFNIKIMGYGTKPQSFRTR